MPQSAPDRILVKVQACGLNPADWALCRGLFPGSLPRGIGLDVAGTVVEIGERVTDLEIGDRVLGVADYAGSASAGAADFAILNFWTRMPSALDMVQAAALPMAVETAYRSLEWLGVTSETTVLINGGGTMVGFAAAQIARLRGATVTATAGEAFADRLRERGITVTSYGSGMVQRVRKVIGTVPDCILDTAPVNLNPGIAPEGGVLPDLIEIAGGDPSRILTTTDFGAAAKLGVRNGVGEPGTGPGGATLRYDVLPEFAQLAADGKFVIPIARTFGLEDWREAMDVSLSGQARGKLMLLP